MWELTLKSSKNLGAVISDERRLQKKHFKKGLKSYHLRYDGLSRIFVKFSRLKILQYLFITCLYCLLLLEAVWTNCTAEETHSYI